MKEINLNFNLKDLSGGELHDGNVGKLLSHLLASDGGQNPIKFWTWAQLFYAGQTIKIDAQDIELLKNFITTTDKLTALAKAQMLEVLQK